LKGKYEHGVGKTGRGTKDTLQRSKLEISFSLEKKKRGRRINIRIPRPLIFLKRNNQNPRRRVRKTTKSHFDVLKSDSVEAKGIFQEG